MPLCCVHALVCRAETEFEIFYSVVRPVFVDVVYHFVTLKLAAKKLFHFKPVLIKDPAISWGCGGVCGAVFEDVPL